MNKEPDPRTQQPVEPRRIEHSEPELTRHEVVLRGEGGSITKGLTVAGEPCVLVNECALLEEDDESGGISCYLFYSEAERDRYIEQRWSPAIKRYRARLSRR
ncbi:hypothetical protein [Aestuariirhabdus sp. LZHN29]|uniref:hypothetical protein n=1 Tax=Aestuariirhabdus sp. LZHN29 TaxID=3417462 RepID=UPI003CE94DC9